MCVAKLIKPTINTWDLSLITSLYNKEEAETILNISMPKLRSLESQDKIIWPLSTTGKFQVKKAYSILLNDNLPARPNPPAIPQKIWKTLWKIPLP